MLKNSIAQIRRYSTTRLQAWEAHTKANCIQHTADDIVGSPLNLLGNTLGDPLIRNSTVPKHGATIPPCWHHVYFPPRTLEPDLAQDGYEAEYFPPDPFSQRMWVGAKMNWSVENPLKVGDHATMVTALDHAELRQGRMGESAMVWINKDISNERGWSMREQRCLVYHAHQTTTNGTFRGIQSKKEPEFSRTLTPSSIFLFRYSALTFNSHKIHFDNNYAMNVEHHPACLVHGPLSGTLMIDLLRRHLPERSFISAFEYKCLAPLYVDQPMTIMGRKSRQGYELWVTNHLGHLAVKGSADAIV